MPIYNNPEEIAKAIKTNIRTFTARFTEDAKNKLYENTQEYWYDAYSPIFYKRMGEDGGVLGAIKRTPIHSSARRDWEATIYFDINEIKRDVSTYTDNTGRSIQYGRHTDDQGNADYRKEVIGWMENDGVRGHEQPAEMIARTAEWIEYQLSDVKNVEKIFNETSGGINLEFIKR